MEQVTLKQLTDALKGADRKVAAISGMLDSAGEKAANILEARSRLDQAIGATGQAIIGAGGDQTKLEVLQAQLAQQLVNRKALSAQIEGGLAQESKQALAEFAGMANACLAICPAIHALAQNAGQLPAPVARELFNACGKIKL